MGLKLDQVVPWGRTMDEYIQMFDLRPAHYNLAILDCAGGPASFNAEMTERGYCVVSADPLYEFTPDAIGQRINQTYNTIIGQMEVAKEGYTWNEISSPEALGQIRMAAMKFFLQDFSTGLKEGRYIPAALPKLPFSNDEFNLALCSHFLFTYSNQLSLEFHVEAILELCRVANEVRIFPLMDTTGVASWWVDPVIERLKKDYYHCELRTVPYEFQKGANTMLKITS